MPTTLATLNVNGIRSADRRGFRRWLKRARPDYLCLQELRATVDDVEDELRSPAGWNTRWLSAQKKGYSGVGLYTRGAPESYEEGHGFDHCAGEGRMLRANFRDLSLVSLYVPSGTSSEERLRIKLRFMGLLLPRMKELLEERRPIAVCGDFNVAHTELDLANPRSNAQNSGFLPEERAWFSKLLEQGWVDIVRQLHPGKKNLYSWWSNRGEARKKDVGWRLDYVLCSPELAPRVKKAWIERKAGLSDHAPVCVELADA